MCSSSLDDSSCSACVGFDSARIFLVSSSVFSRRFELAPRDKALMLWAKLSDSLPSSIRNASRGLDALGWALGCPRLLLRLRRDARLLIGFADASPNSKANSCVFTNCFDITRACRPPTTPQPGEGGGLLPSGAEKARVGGDTLSVAATAAVATQRSEQPPSHHPPTHPPTHPPSQRQRHQPAESRESRERSLLAAVGSTPLGTACTSIRIQACACITLLY